ncbi:protein with a Dodecin-like topology [Legionella birminghamensis]|uniref:Protein with a Dodecin-like topology n=1 Tax=Legionella birminghamensis TaxID=28083 RepID=A0A378I9D1_9GAMM|nr:dodecin family protein [Legionella birminghamensis]KTC67951.1 protein with a Dodecin-like topology [Legionella birminghamensis]STX31340.1 protein with a Dodecin-like topology [Legionella birminghamensis]
MRSSAYQIMELTGTSDKGVEEAITDAIVQASKSYGNLAWYEVIRTENIIEGRKNKLYQAQIKFGCHAH